MLLGIPPSPVTGTRDQCDLGEVVYDDSEAQQKHGQSCDNEPNHHSSSSVSKRRIAARLTHASLLDIPNSMFESNDR